VKETRLKRVQHGFSVLLKSKDYIDNISISEKGGEPVRSRLGELQDIEIIEGTVLYISGTKGESMVDIKEDGRARGREA
jgi:hypothetical protein